MASIELSGEFHGRPLADLPAPIVANALVQKLGNILDNGKSTLQKRLVAAGKSEEEIAGAVSAWQENRLNRLWDGTYYDKAEKAGARQPRKSLEDKIRAEVIHALLETKAKAASAKRGKPVKVPNPATGKDKTEKAKIKADYQALAERVANGPDKEWIDNEVATRVAQAKAAQERLGSEGAQEEEDIFA